MRISKLSWAVLLFLAACGGDGDGGGEVPGGVTKTPLAIGAGNYVAVATESVSSVSYVMDATAFVTGAQVSSQGSVLDFARVQALKLPRWFAAATPWASGAEALPTEACSGGGYLSFALNDINGNQQLDVGESVTIVANQCVEFDSTVNGTMLMQVTKMSGDLDGEVYQLGVTTTLTDLSVVMADESSVGNGSIGIEMSMTAPNTGSMVLRFDALNMSGTYGGASYSRTLWDFNITDTYAPVNNMFHGSVVLSGVLGSSALDSRAVTLSTLQPMVSVGEDEYPSSGQILATGAAASKMRMTVQNAATVLIELDANGDGTYETMIIKPWSELM